MRRCHFNLISLPLLFSFLTNKISTKRLEDTVDVVSYKIDFKINKFLFSILVVKYAEH